MLDELIKRAKKGDNKAFQELIIYYKNDLYKIAKTRLSNIEDIDYAIKETIISAYESIHILVNLSKFKSWIITILINKCNAIYNRKQKDNIVSYDFMEGEKFIPKVHDINSNIEFDALLRPLNSDERTIVVLYYNEGYKVEEISKILKINSNTVKTKLYRARKKIMEDLKEGCIDG